MFDKQGRSDFSQCSSGNLCELKSRIDFNVRAMKLAIAFEGFKEFSERHSR